MGYASGVVRKTLVSAAIAASIGAAALTTLTLYLNPALVLRREAVALVLCLVLPWAAGGTLALGLLAGMVAAVRPRPRSARPVVEGSPFFAFLTFVALALVAALYWQNLFAYRDAIPLDALRALAISSIVVSAAAAVLLAIGTDALLFPGLERPIGAALAILAPAAALAVPLALRPPPSPPGRPVPVQLDAGRPSRHVVLVGIDGLSPSDLDTSAPGEGVPSLARLAHRGALGPLATLHPTEGPPVWTTMMTGRLPRDHGIKSASTYRLLASASDWVLLPKGALVGLLERAGLVSRHPVASTSRRRRAVWNILDAFGIPSGLVRVWGTYPPETIRGFVVSPYFHLLAHDPARAPGTVHPRDLLAEIAARAVAPADVDPSLLGELVQAPAPSTAPRDDALLRRLAAEALAPDLTYERAADVLRPAYDPAFFVIAFHGYDVAGHAFYRYAHPEAFGDVSSEAARRYGPVLARYASLLGQWVTGLERDLDPDDVLIVVSGYGLQPTPLWRRLVGVLTGTEVGAATHAAAPPGLFLAVGGGIRPGSVPHGASVLDVTPTILYLMGLPVGRDMEGRVLTEILEPDFASEHPVTFIPSYESLAVTPAAPGASLEELPPLPEERP
jgi:predicted AlkP superfamily phosphohydrolase/phosphomutase